MEAILHTCKYCGAPGVDYSAAQDGVAKCVYCANLNDVPGKRAPAELAFALNNADNELFNCRFEEAREGYSKVITMAPNDPQGYFGRALAKFRIKYLRDERYSTEKETRYQPICYGASEKLFSKDADYLKAMELATSKQRELYAQQAKEIDTITENFHQLKARGIDYDTFICCKVTDDATKQKTHDAYDAQRIYINLQSKGFKPFFSEMDMGDFTGGEYEAVILYALYTSKSMLIVCSNEDYLDTPWVKNEYSRYLAMIANGYKQAGSLTFVYKGKPIEMLPNGKKIQGIDRDMYGASDRIADFVRKHLPKAQAVATKFCARCGAEMPITTKFCTQCACGEFVATHDEFVKNQAVSQVRKEQAERDKKREEELAALRRQLEEAQRQAQQPAAQPLSEADRRSREAFDRQQATISQEEEARLEAEADKYLQFKPNEDGGCSVVGTKARLPEKLIVPMRFKGYPVTRIEDNAFSGHKDLFAITLPEGLKRIGLSSFENCTNLTGIEMPTSLTYIGNSAFNGCSSLRMVTLPAGLKEIGFFGFADCRELNRINLPDGLETIYGSAFENCKALSKISIPSSVRSVWENAFSGCTGLRTVTMPRRFEKLQRRIFKTDLELIRFSYI